MVNTPGIAELIEAIRAVEAEHGPARVGLDLLGGIAALLVLLFVGILAMVTVVELAAGKPLSDLLRGGPATGTSLFDGGTNGGSPSRHPTPTGTISSPMSTGSPQPTTPSESTPSPTEAAPSPTSATPNASSALPPSPTTATSH